MTVDEKPTTGWALACIGGPLAANDNPPMEVSDGGRTIMRWLIAKHPHWFGTEDDRAAIVWLSQCILRDRPCIAMRGPKEGDGRFPRIDSDAMLGIISLPQRIECKENEREGEDKREQITQRLVVVRRDRPHSESGTQDERTAPPVAGGAGVLTKCGEHLMGELPELSDIIRKVMIETTVQGTS